MTEPKRRTRKPYKGVEKPPVDDAGSSGVTQPRKRRTMPRPVDPAQRPPGFSLPYIRPEETEES